MFLAEAAEVAGTETGTDFSLVINLVVM